MIYVQPDLWVVVEEMEGKNAPVPKPLQNGFSEGVAYRVIGAMGDIGECYMMLSNDNNEVWYVSNRHLRTLNASPNPPLRRTL